MQMIRALSLTTNVNHWMANTSQPRILHIFDRACNLINEHREVLSIVTPPIGNGPFNLVVDENACFTEHLSLQSPISISSNKIVFGKFIIYFGEATLWNPRLDWERLHNQRDRIVNRLTALTRAIYQPLLPQSLVSNLSFALAHGDLSSALQATHQLAGLGAGLTPAGDDVIMGAIHAAWIIHPPEVASAWTQAIADTAAPLTTSLSAAWLRAAGRGEAGVLWHEFFEALVGRVSDPTYLQATIDTILSVGETSGADALAGFSSTMIAWAASSNRK